MPLRYNCLVQSHKITKPHQIRLAFLVILIRSESNEDLEDSAFDQTVICTFHAHPTVYNNAAVRASKRRWEVGQFILYGGWGLRVI